MINGYRNEEGYKEYLNPDDEKCQMNMAFGCRIIWI